MNSETWQVKATILLVSSLTIMSMITISASLPDMTKTFELQPNGAALVKLSLSFPGLFIALSAIIAGIIIDKIGRLKLLGAALIFYAIGGTSGYYLDDIYLILAGRALLGICVGITMTIVTTLVADYYQGQARQKFAGLQIAVMSIGGIIFITLGGRSGRYWMACSFSALSFFPPYPAGHLSVLKRACSIYQCSKDLRA